MTARSATDKKAASRPPMSDMSQGFCGSPGVRLVAVGSAMVLVLDNVPGGMIIFGV